MQQGDNGVVRRYQLNTAHLQRGEEKAFRDSVSTLEIAFQNPSQQGARDVHHLHDIVNKTYTTLVEEHQQILRELPVEMEELDDYLHPFELRLEELQQIMNENFPTAPDGLRKRLVTYRCTVCENIKFYSKDALTYHRQIFHPEDVRYQDPLEPLDAPLEFAGLPAPEALTRRSMLGIPTLNSERVGGELGRRSHRPPTSLHHLRTPAARPGTSLDRRQGYRDSNMIQRLVTHDEPVYPARDRIADYHSRQGSRESLASSHHSQPNDPYEGRDTRLPNQYRSGRGGPSDDDPSSDSDGGGDRDDRSRTPMVVGEIPGEVHLEMMNHMTPMDPPFIVEEVVDVEENATP